MPATYTVHLTDSAGSFDTTLDAPRPTRMTPLLDENNGPGNFMFTMGLYDPQIAGVVPWATEVAVYREGDVDPVWAGPIVDDDVDFAEHTVTFTCGGLLDYFYQRLIDAGAGRTDLLEGDGDFEEGAVGDSPPGWAIVEDPDLPGLTAEIDDTEHRHGARSVKLTQPDAAADAYIKKQFTFTAGDIGDVIVFKAWFKLDGASWVGPALEGWGMVLRQIVAGVPLETEQGWRDSNRITSDTQRGVWLRIEDAISVLPGVTAVIEVDHFAPGGISWWDYTAGFLMESLSLPDTDQADIAAAIINFLQSGDKSDLGILVDCPLTGVILSMTWQFADHTPGNVALGQLTGVDYGVDFGITAADRTFRTWFPHRGTDRTGTVTLVPDVNCIVKTRKFDGRSAANQVTQGWLGDGPDREEEGATDPAAFGGVTLQKYLPPVGSPEVDTLAASAMRALSVSKVPVVYEATIFDPDLQATLEMGDTVAAGWDLGYVQEGNNLRIITYARDPNTDALIVQLTPNGVGVGDDGTYDGTGTYDGAGSYD